MAVNDPHDRPTPEPDLLAVAAGALRDAVNDEWSRVRDDVVAAVRDAVRPAWPIRAAMGDLPDDGREPHTPDRARTHISSRVVSASLGQVLATEHECAVAEVHLDLTGDQLHRTTLDVVATQGVDLRELGAEIRSTAEALLAQLLGPAAAVGAPHRIDVRITDVSEDDPRLV